jgi:hypothetical protein
MLGISELGLLFIGASWFIQVFDTSPKNTKLNRQFVLLYGLGVALVLVDGVMQGYKHSPSAYDNITFMKVWLAE